MFLFPLQLETDFQIRNHGTGQGLRGSLNTLVGAITAPTTGRFTDHIESVSIGLNWILGDHMIARHAYVQSFYADDVILNGSSMRSEGALMIEWQLHF